jgi:hypothetical protein
MKFSKSLLLAGLLLSAFAVQADGGRNSFESGSQPHKRMTTQSHPAHGWQAGQSESDGDHSALAALGSQSDAVSDTTDLAPVSAVPEPETFAMMLAGIGLIGTIVRRRKANPEA